jgi:hypothetical protein
MVDAIHIHEDDWGLRNLYPMAAWPEVARDLAESIAATERNRAPDGYGWLAMHMIEAPSVDYAALRLRLSDVEAELSAIMPRVTRFAATIFSYIGSVEKDPYGSDDDRACCFGFDATCFIKIEPEGELVKTIWFDFTSGDAEAEQAMRRAFAAIDALVPSLLVDYHKDVQGPMGDPAFLDRYFAEIREWRAAVDKSIEAHQESDAKRP